MAMTDHSAGPIVLILDGGHANESNHLIDRFKTAVFRDEMLSVVGDRANNNDYLVGRLECIGRKYYFPR